MRTIMTRSVEVRPAKVCTVDVCICLVDFYVRKRLRGGNQSRAVLSR